ncbi:Abortive infection protein [Thalictrum thalictroides]|uniref:Abortive infection protein n=1 Tax=Thalictrum thalictroides TaxID=46969 RepID=A0A7J6W9C9_THATH|nr:Abortive infection protein [Thalictrum thalictroides]
MPYDYGFYRTANQLPYGLNGTANQLPYGFLSHGGSHRIHLPIGKQKSGFGGGFPTPPCGIHLPLGMLLTFPLSLRNRIKESNRISSDEYSEKAVESSSSEDLTAESTEVLSANKSISSTSRSVVLQACTVTSGLILALGLVIRQISHFAFTEGLPVVDCSTEVSFKFEVWHLELIVGLVIVISSCRYLLLQTWSDFAESSEAANQQVLSSLQPVDYIIVAFLPGVSEELLFRGALLPLFGLNWKSALVAAAVFGALHLGSGRKYSFAIWATFVGLAYGYATIVTSSIIVPITSHALNNLIGGILWRSMSTTSEKR